MYAQALSRWHGPLDPPGGPCRAVRPGHDPQVARPTHRCRLRCRRLGRRDRHGHSAPCCMGGPRSDRGYRACLDRRPGARGPQRSPAKKQEAAPRGAQGDRLLRGQRRPDGLPALCRHRWPIGSGMVESTCRLVSNLSTKQPGMRWSEAGVQAIPSLRARSLFHDHLWQEFFRLQPQRRRPPVVSLTRSTPATTNAATHAAAT